MSAHTKSTKCPTGCPCGLNLSSAIPVDMNGPLGTMLMMSMLGMPFSKTVKKSYEDNKMYKEWNSNELQGALKTLRDVIDSEQVDIIIGRAMSESMNFHLADHWIGPLERMLQGATIQAFITVVKARSEEFKKITQFTEIVLSSIRRGALTPEQIVEINQAVPLHFTSQMVDTLFAQATLEQIKAVASFFDLHVTKEHLEKSVTRVERKLVYWILNRSPYLMVTQDLTQFVFSSEFTGARAVEIEKLVHGILRADLTRPSGSYRPTREVVEKIDGTRKSMFSKLFAWSWPTDDELKAQEQKDRLDAAARKAAHILKTFPMKKGAARARAVEKYTKTIADIPQARRDAEGLPAVENLPAELEDAASSSAPVKTEPASTSAPDGVAATAVATSVKTEPASTSAPDGVAATAVATPVESAAAAPAKSGLFGLF